MSYHSLPGGANIKYVNSQWKPMSKIKPSFTYRRGNPAGYTDDLGIIADCNQWVEAQTPGWISDIDPQDFMAMREWCEQNLKDGTWGIGVYYIILQNEEDVAWFMLRWL
jgi:hypothetical protein